MKALVARARRAPFISVDTETVIDAGAPPIITPLRANLVGISIAVAPGEAFYLPFAHRQRESEQGDLSLGTSPKAADKQATASIAARMLADGPHCSACAARAKRLPDVDPTGSCTICSPR